MADFENSFRQGMDAAKAALKARIEIDAVFTDLNRQLSLASDGTAKIEIMELEEVLRRQDSILASLSAFSAALMPKETRRYKAIVVGHLNDADFRVKEVARWKQDPNGYPCWIIVGDSETACSDKQSLEGELAALASSPKVGEAVLAAMNHVQKSARKQISAPPAQLDD